MPDYNAQLYVKMYSKLALALGVTPREEDPQIVEMIGGPLPRGGTGLPAIAGGDDPQSLLAVFNPGQYIPPNMDPVTKKDDRYALSVLFDAVPQFSWVYKPAASPVSNTYDSILKYKEAPISNLTPEQKQKLEEADVIVNEYGGVYNQYELAYYQALDAYDAAYATWVNGGPPIPRTTLLKLESAYQAWVGLGHKNAYESAIAVIGAYEGLEPQKFWKDLSTRYDRGTEYSGGNSSFQVVGMSPPYKTWFQDTGWTEFTFTQNDMDNQRNSEAIGVSGNLDMTYGIFRVSGDGSFQQDSKYVKIDQTELNFSCKLMRITLDRGWMNPLVLSSRAWRWAKGTPVYGSKLSTGGDIFDDVAPTGNMTVIPTAAILSKDLVVTGVLNKTQVEEFNREIAANASVGIGPFSIAGRFNMENHPGSEKGNIAANGIKAPDIQIIAFICALLPESPNPDSNLVWPS